MTQTAQTQKTLLDALGITVICSEKERVVATMPVDDRTMQPHGYLHGGASMALAETVASIGGDLNCPDDQHVVFGMEINANHLRSVQDGTVTATALPLHRGRSSQVWEIQITDDSGRVICISRCTLAVQRLR